MKLLNKCAKDSRYSRNFSAILQHCYFATLIVMPVALLSGCMGIYEGGFECPPGTGVGCKSISEINTMINQGIIPTGELPKGIILEIDLSKIQVEPPTPINHEIWYAPHGREQKSENRNQENPSNQLDKMSSPKKGVARKDYLSDV